MKIIFMGTPEFALPALKALHLRHQVVAVYTQAPKPAGRGHKEKLSPIHELALKLNLKVYTPKTLRNELVQAEFSAIKADLAVVAAYGLILPKAILLGCPYGCINIHPSLLPNFRGAAPLQRSILSGTNETAMCIMQMDEGIDTGDVLAMEKVALSDRITYPELSDKMANLGGKLLLEVIDNIDNITPQKQLGEGSYAAKITKEEGELNWHEASEVLMRKVRALSPWPGTYFYNNGEKIKVMEAKNYKESHEHKPGTIIDPNNLIITCSEGLFQPLVLQRPGKNPLKLQDFLRGYSINEFK
jgi:methionyl-tRNA formyltransferase